MKNSEIHSVVWKGDAVAARDVPFATISDHLADESSLIWVGIRNPNAQIFEQLGGELGLEPAAIEDALNHVERPKAVRYGSYSFVTVYAAVEQPPVVDNVEQDEELALAKVSSFVFPRGMVSVWYDDRFGFDEIIDRWNEAGNLGRHGSPMLVHGMLDYIVDGYFHRTQSLDDEIEELEDEVLEQHAGTTRGLQRRIYRLRKSLVRLRRAVVPMREVVASIMRHRRETDGDPSLDPWFDDLYDHSLRAAEWADSLRDLVTTIFETNMSLQDTRLNIVMRQLAAWAAIIAVPTAITGWFGHNLPYLGFGQDWGVWASVISIGLVSVVLYWSFKKRGWL